jgi:Fe-S oxidoreductase
LHLDLKPVTYKKALLHGHCHQKAFGVMADVETVLNLVPELDVETIDTGCCGMAGAFGYDANNYATSMAMGELGLLPAVRDADDDVLIVADGTSCRSQVRDGSSREGMHVARVLAAALN